MMSAAVAFVLAVIVVSTLAYLRAPAILWAISVLAGYAAVLGFSGWSDETLAGAGVALGLLLLLLSPTPVRRHLLAAPMLTVFRRVLPRMSQTEQEALDAGTTWWDAELFSGAPDWARLRALAAPSLSPEEQAFLDGPVVTLCEMLDDWEITQDLHDLRPEAWDFIREQGFLGMIIPREFGGKGFSALAHSEVIMRLTTRSGTAAVSVMVPNSLGPAELLLHYGTDEQKKYYLPRLARGEEMPCFALTSPDAGSDAGSIPDFGVVCRGNWKGASDVLGIRVTWEKRYITLAPVATLLGLAFQLRDPDGLLGENRNPGITLALIPVDTPGVHIGRRHLPLNAAFMNGPTWGRDVFIPMDCVIGGAVCVGRGWRMLMNCLAAGRSISLPANAVGMAKVCAFATGAYGRVRRQFNMPIGQFEGVEEALSRIGGNLYVMDAARTMTAGALDLGEKPAVVSAIVKYHLTERARQVINDAMDVHGGKGICMGPSNYLARAYQQTPIAITVEGANILTRSMIIFGQGAIRSHPYVLAEIDAVATENHALALTRFDRALFGHVLFALSNAVRSVVLGITSARFVRAAGDRHTRRYYGQLTRMSAAFAFVADVAMLSLGGALKRRERLSGRMGDILSQLYLASAVLKRFGDDGSPESDAPFMHWGVQDALARIEDAFDAFFLNFPVRWAGCIMRIMTFPPLTAGRRHFPYPDDVLGGKLAKALIEPGGIRDRLTHGVFVSTDSADPIAILQRALSAAVAAELVEAKLRAAVREGRLSPEAQSDYGYAVACGIISGTEEGVAREARTWRRKAIMVDDFPKDFGRTEIYQTTEPVDGWRTGTGRRS